MLQSVEKTNLEIEARLCELHAQACRSKIELIDLAADIPELHIDPRAAWSIDKRISAARSLLSRLFSGCTFNSDDVALAQLAANLPKDETNDE